MEVVEEDYGALLIIIASLAAFSFLICLLCMACHCRKKQRRHHRQLGLHRNAHYDSTTSATGKSISSWCLVPCSSFFSPVGSHITYFFIMGNYDFILFNLLTLGNQNLDISWKTECRYG